MSAPTRTVDLDDGIDGGAQLGVVVPLLGGLVGRLRPADLNLSTPCSSWTTRDLLNHVVGGALMYADAFEGGPVEDISGRLPDVVGDDPLSAFQAAAGRFGEATQSAGAMDRVFALPWGSMSGPTFLRFVGFDLLMHSWDLAATLGEEPDVSDEFVAEVSTFAHHVLDPWTRDGINFADEVPSHPDDTALNRLAAYSGRRRG